MREFDDDEVGYETWQGGNPRGFVLNVRRTRSGGTMLHRVGCLHIRPYPGWDYTKGQKIKLCSTDDTELVEASRRLGQMKSCRTCSP